MFSPAGIAAVAVCLARMANAIPAPAAAVASISTANSSTSSQTPGPARNLVLNPYDTELFPFNILPANPSLASFCSSSFLSVENQYFETAALFSWTDPAYTYPAAHNPSSTITVAAESGVEYSKPWTFTASKPCCLDCTLFGGSIQVYYWPSSLSSGEASTVVVSAETFTSPSIYVEFQSLQATDYCGPVSSGYSTPHVMAFDPTELSTAMAWTYNAHEYIRPLVMNNTWSQGQWSTLSTCSNLTTTLWSLDKGGFTSYANAEEAASSALIVAGTISQTITGPLVYEYKLTYNPCSPSLSVPTQSFTINPGWQSCKQGLSAFYDPPSALTPVAGPKTTAPSSSSTIALPVKDTTTSAVPGPTITPTTAQPTATVSKNTATATSSPSDTVEPAPASTVLVGPSTTIVDPASIHSPSSALGHLSNTTTTMDTTPNSSAGEVPPLDTHTGVIITPSAPAMILPTLTNPGDASIEPADTSIAAPSPLPSTISSDTTPNSSGAEVPPLDTNTGAIITPTAPAIVLPTFANPGNASIPTAAPLSSAASMDTTPNSDAGEVPPLDTNTGVIITPTAPALILPTITNPSEITVSAGNQLIPQPHDDISTPTSINQIDTQTLAGSAVASVPGTTLPQPTISYAVGTQNLNPGGPAITVSGTVVSLANSESVVVDGATKAISSATASGGVGGFILTIGGFGAPSSTVTASPTASAFNGTIFSSESPKNHASPLLLLGLLGVVGLMCS